MQKKVSKEKLKLPYTWILLRIRPVLRLFSKFRGTPEAIAGGFSLGFFLALTPTVGVQVILAIFLATLFKVSRPAAIVPVWITNPVTIAPIFTFNYWVGSLLLPGPSVKEVYSYFMDVAARIARLDIWDIRSLFETLAQTGKEIMGPLLLGSFIVATLVGLLSYALLLRLFTFLGARHRRKIARKEQLLQQAAASAKQPPQN